MKDNTTVLSRLAEARRRRALSAADLAGQAGVSRQTVYAMEAGNYIPNTAVALRLARVLETSVEELFRLDATPAAPRPAHAEIVEVGERFAGEPLELCRVDGRLIAVPATPAPWQLAPADAVLADPARGTVHPFGEENTAARLLIAGCDPAVSVLRRHLERAGVGLVTAPVNSSVAMDLLHRRMAHIAGTHLKAGAAPPARGLAVFRFAAWEQGLCVARRNPKKIRSVEDLTREGVRLANREKGSGARQLLDARLREARIAMRRVGGYRDRPAAGHLSAAWRVHSGAADCCIATRSSARAFGLDFIPLTTEHYDLVLRQEHLALSAVERLLDTLTHSALRRELEGQCAYDTRETGRRVA